MNWMESLKMICEIVGIAGRSLMEIVVALIIFIATLKAFLQVPICQFKCRKGWGDFAVNVLSGGLVFGLGLWLYLLDLKQLSGLAVSPLRDVFMDSNSGEFIAMGGVALAALFIANCSRPLGKLGAEGVVFAWTLLLFVIVFCYCSYEFI